MSRSKLIISIALILSIALGILVGIYFYTKKTTQGNLPTQTDKTIFGGVGGVRTDLPTDNTNNPQGQTTSGTEKPTGTSTPKATLLRRIAIGPISGDDFVMRDVFATTSNSSTTQTVGTSTKKQTIKVTVPAKPKLLGQEEKIRYMERGTGRVFEAEATTSTIQRITNSTYTRTVESFFDKKGDNVLFRNLLENTDTIQTRLGTVSLDTPTSTEYSLKTKDFPYNLLSVVTSPEKDSFASYFESKGVGSSINISRFDGTGVFTVYKSPFREWLLSWPNTNTLVLNTKPSTYSPGYAYSINIKTKAFSRITGGQNGLTTLVSPDGLNVLVGESIDGSMKLSILNLKTQSFREIYTRTLPEKCVWSKLEKSVLFCAASESIVYAPYPDAWYQGLVFFDDNVWKINIDTQENKLIAVVKDTVKDGLDITNMILNKNEDYMLLTNKKDLSLWGLQIEKPVAVVATTTPSRVKNTTTSTTTKATSSKATNTKK
ncbi:MAG: hypothetical protein WCQ00_01000 [bacterium]